MPYAVVAKKKLKASKFGHISYAKKVTFPPNTSSNVIKYCYIYEELLRSFFKECKVWDNKITIKNGIIYLNSIDRLTSEMIINFINKPSNKALAKLYSLIRVYKSFPDVIAKITCRNLKLDFTELATESELYNIHKKFLDGSNRKATIKNKEEVDKIAFFSKRLFFIIKNDSKIFIINGELDPLTSANSYLLCMDKYSLFRIMNQLNYGFNVPNTTLLDSGFDINKIQDTGAKVIFKPINGTSRTGVIGPIDTNNNDLLKRAYKRCLQQAIHSNVCICQEYVEGSMMRINIDNGKITFIAKAVNKPLIGDGIHNIRYLLDNSIKSGKLVNIGNDYVLNAILGSGKSFNSVPHKNERIFYSLDGNESGGFVDVTEKMLKYALPLLKFSKMFHLPSIGIDAIFNSKEKTFYVIDINPEHGVDFFSSTEKAYATVEHMMRNLIRSKT